MSLVHKIRYIDKAIFFFLATYAGHFGDFYVEKNQVGVLVGLD